MQSKATDDALFELCKLSFPCITVKTAICSGDLLLSGKFVVDGGYSNTAFGTAYPNWQQVLSTLPQDQIPGACMLAPVFLLSYAYSASNELGYIKLASLLAKAWAKYDDDAEDKPAVLWTPRVVSARVSALVFFAIMQESTNALSDKWLAALLDKHCHWLMTQANYKAKHNEGILMDMALIIAGVYLSNSEFIGCGSTRLCTQLAFIFPNKGAYRGNASSYHIDMLWRLFAPFYYLERLALPAVHKDKIKTYKDGAVNFATHLVTPTAQVMGIGSCFSSFFRASKGTMRECRKLEHMGLAYALSQGRHGTMPAENMKTFHADGYAFFRSSWDGADFESATWLCLKAGFSSLVRKHQDDLSVMLVTKGVQVFIDPGMHVKGAIAHDYLQSALAHSGVIVDNGPYLTDKKAAYKTGLFNKNFYSGKSLLVKAGGYNNQYPGVFIDRAIMYVSKDEFYIVDDIFAEAAHEYTQNFHLSDEVEVTAHTAGFSSIKLKDTLWNVCIYQYEAVDAVAAAHGKTGDITTMSIHGVSRENVKDTTSLRFTKKGQCARFVTGVRMVHDDEMGRVFESPLNGNHLTIGGEVVDISPRRRAMPVEVKVTLEDGQLIITQTEGYGEYAYFLLGKETGKSVGRVPYSKAPSVIMALPADGAYVLQAHNRVQGGEVARWVAGEVVLQGGALVYRQV